MSELGGSLWRFRIPGFQIRGRGEGAIPETAAVAAVREIGREVETEKRAGEAAAADAGEKGEAMAMGRGEWMNGGGEGIRDGLETRVRDLDSPDDVF